MDRNLFALAVWPGLLASLSARRAWIEMHPLVLISPKIGVALRKESVDRNNIALASMRVSIVALRKESVDRNRDDVSD